jgi:hypothetical protein
LLEQAVTHRHHGGNNTIDAGLPLGQLLCSLTYVPPTTFADHQTKRFQNPAHLIVDAHAHVDQLVPSNQQSRQASLNAASPTHHHRKQTKILNCSENVSAEADIPRTKSDREVPNLSRFS